jgi:hypothetical protein
MTLNERHNEVLKSHAAFMNAIGVAAAGGGGFTAITSNDWRVAGVFLFLSVLMHLIATQILERLRVSP